MCIDIYINIGNVCIRLETEDNLITFFKYDKPNLSSWVGMDLFINHSCEHLHKKFAINENPIISEISLYPTHACKCV